MADLIDRDILFRTFEEHAWLDNADKEIAEDLLLDAPFVDVVEIKHGHWNNYDTGYDYKWECSCCGHLIDNPYGAHPEQTQTNYCPNCGARMEN